jgi:hypothetical protein
MMLLKPDRKYK